MGVGGWRARPAGVLPLGGRGAMQAVRDGDGALGFYGGAWRFDLEGVGCRGLGGVGVGFGFGEGAV